MCLPIDCWLGCMPRTIDDDPAPASRARSGRSHYTHHYNGYGYAARGRVATDHKASNDARRDHAHVVAAGAAAAHKGWHGHATTAAAAQEKAAAMVYPYAGADGLLKQQQLTAAWNGRVAAADGHGAARRGVMPYNYYEHAQPAAAHREDTTDSHYTPATAIADHESSSEALGEK